MNITYKCFESMKWIQILKDFFCSGKIQETKERKDVQSG